MIIAQGANSTFDNDYMSGEVTYKYYNDMIHLYEFEKIHPFQDGNGRVGRLIMFKECLRNGITPFIIEDDIKEFYYRGLKEWKNEKVILCC